jgi:hypothetical protein
MSAASASLRPLEERIPVRRLNTSGTCVPRTGPTTPSPVTWRASRRPRPRPGALACQRLSPGDGRCWPPATPNSGRRAWFDGASRLNRGRFTHAATPIDGPCCDRPRLGWCPGPTGSWLCGGVTMGPVRIIATVAVGAALAVTGCASRTADQTAAPASAAPSSAASTTRSTSGAAETTTTTQALAGKPRTMPRPALPHPGWRRLT